jgi:hypothetical protein
MAAPRPGRPCAWQLVTRTSAPGHRRPHALQAQGPTAPLAALRVLRGLALSAALGSGTRRAGDGQGEGGCHQSCTPGRVLRGAPAVPPSRPLGPLNAPGHACMTLRHCSTEAQTLPYNIGANTQRQQIRCIYVTLHCRPARATAAHGRPPALPHPPLPFSAAAIAPPPLTTPHRTAPPAPCTASCEMFMSNLLRMLSYLSAKPLRFFDFCPLSVVHLILPLHMEHRWIHPLNIPPFGEIITRTAMHLPLPQADGWPICAACPALPRRAPLRAF